LGADSDGTIYYYSLTEDFTADLFRSTDGGMTWDGGTDGYGGDKAWMTIDRSGIGGPGPLYFAWSWAAACCDLDTFTRARIISGQPAPSFMVPIELPQSPVFGTLAVGPDRELYVVGIDYPTYGNPNFLVDKSTNAYFSLAVPSFPQVTAPAMGGSFNGGTGPNPGGLLGQVWVAVNHAAGPARGHVYVLSSVNPPGTDPMDVMFVRSTDGGATWSAPVRVNNDIQGSNRWSWFGTMSVAPNGRIDVVWNDTRANVVSNLSELYYASSTDEGVTWSLNVAASPVFNSHVGWPNQNKIGDYYHMVSDNVGAHLAYSATFNNEQDVYYLRIGPRLGDSDGDDDLDLRDYAALQECYSITPLPAGCETLDFTSDGVVNGTDYRAFHSAFTGPV